jgi:acetylornithine deacetylase/succinyl-diaminopimelate desuccinylase-like protein
MMNLRDIDVHQGRSDGKTLATMIPIEPVGTEGRWRDQQRPNYAIFGIAPPLTEHKNPDGGIVSSVDGLQGTMCLYVTIAGKTSEASNACRQFLDQLTSLIEALEAANVPPLGRMGRLWRWLRITRRWSGRER